MSARLLAIVPIQDRSKVARSCFSNSAAFHEFIGLAAEFLSVETRRQRFLLARPVRTWPGEAAGTSPGNGGGGQAIFSPYESTATSFCFT